MKNNKNKKSNEKAKANAALLFKSLVNNETAVIGARRKGWWWALIMLLFSGLVAAIPATVNASKTKGSDFINVTNVSGFDVSYRKMAETFKDEGIELTVHADDSDKKNNYLEATGFTVADNELKNIYQHYNAEGKLDFEAFYYNGSLSSEVLNRCVSNVATFDSNGDIVYTSRTSSMVLFGKQNVASYLYMTGSTTATGSSYGNYRSFKDGYKITDIIDVKGDDGNAIDTTVPANYAKYCDSVWSNVMSFYVTSYKSTVATTTWQTGLIVLGINYGITLFMGLMVFILTRGKTNAFRIYTFWESQKIAYWAAVAPGILAVAVGFLLSSFSQICFAMLLGIRVMWMAMKTLRPESANEKLLEDVKKDRIVNAK